jgi:hypothetical protein
MDGMDTMDGVDRGRDLLDFVLVLGCFGGWLSGKFSHELSRINTDFLFSYWDNEGIVLVKIIGTRKLMNMKSIRPEREARRGMKAVIEKWRTCVVRNACNTVLPKKLHGKGV